MFDALNFRYPFRKYQRMILAQVESGQGDHKYHIVAPPGAGKTIVGLELIRRFGQPAVIFAPTTTIQEQWRDKLRLFLPDGAADLDALVSLDPRRLASINVFTYQLISTPGESQAWVRELAQSRWCEDLLEGGKFEDRAAAEARLETLRQNNPHSYRRELARRYQRIKRELLRNPAADVRPFLHANARALMDDLVAYGVRTIVLDECHHLLDYWAIVLRYLVAGTPTPKIIGLTATLPSPEDDREYENYHTLVGEVDFEVPTPAVVKEGDLAPYRDLVYFVEPSARELDYLKHIQEAFEEAIGSLTQSKDFGQWVIHTIVAGPFEQEDPYPWEEFLRRKPLLAVAGLRFLQRVGYPLPGEMLLPAEAEGELQLADWAVLLERYALDVLAVSPDPEDHRMLKRLRKMLLQFGFTLTERGMRQSRSAGDLVLTFSEAKDRATAEILAAESQALGEQLRAVVVTDFERMSSGVKRLRGVLDPDAGSAVRVFGYLAAQPDLRALNPVLATGRTLLVDALAGPELVGRFNATLAAEGLRATCRTTPGALPHILEVEGEGPDWNSRTYVRLVTRAFEAGLTRCLVGTRGIFGEGWDSLALNTLIDLTSVTTSTSVQQLRGRSIRLDPRWPRKAAHNWDVICVAKQFERGDVDLRRFVTRHSRYWGVTPFSRAEQVLQDASAMLDVLQSGAWPSASPENPRAYPDPLGGQLHGAIVKGVAHVDPHLAYDLAVKPLKQIQFSHYTAQMLKQIPRRERVCELWKIGEEYSNFVYSATRLDARDLKFRTVFTVQKTLKRMLREFLATMGAGLLLTFYLMGQFTCLSFDAPEMCWMVGVVLLLGLAFTFALNVRSAYRLGRRMLVEQPPDGILLDVGRAVLAALKESRLVSANLQPDYVRVLEQPDNSYDVLLDYASPEDAATFIKTYRQVFEPVRDQRYLILRDDTRLPNVFLRPLWTALRGWFHNQALYKPAYHPVPKILAARKERAEAFERAWIQHVGGGELIYTRSDEGRRILLQARAQRRPKVKGLAFELWR